MRRRRGRSARRPGAARGRLRAAASGERFILVPRQVPLRDRPGAAPRPRRASGRGGEEFEFEADAVRLAGPALGAVALAQLRHRWRRSPSSSCAVKPGNTARRIASRGRSSAASSMSWSRTSSPPRRPRRGRRRPARGRAARPSGAVCGRRPGGRRIRRARTRRRAPPPLFRADDLVGVRKNRRKAAWLSQNTKGAVRLLRFPGTESTSGGGHVTKQDFVDAVADRVNLSKRMRAPPSTLCSTRSPRRSRTATR